MSLWHAGTPGWPFQREPCSLGRAIPSIWPCVQHNGQLTFITYWILPSTCVDEHRYKAQSRKQLFTSKCHYRAMMMGSDWTSDPKHRLRNYMHLITMLYLTDPSKNFINLNEINLINLQAIQVLTVLILTIFQQLFSGLATTTKPTRAAH